MHTNCSSSAPFFHFCQKVEWSIFHTLSNSFSTKEDTDPFLAWSFRVRLPFATNYTCCSITCSIIDKMIIDSQVLSRAAWLPGSNWSSDSVSITSLFIERNSIGFPQYCTLPWLQNIICRICDHICHINDLLHIALGRNHSVANTVFDVSPILRQKTVSGIHIYTWKTTKQYMTSNNHNNYYLSKMCLLTAASTALKGSSNK